MEKNDSYLQVRNLTVHYTSGGQVVHAVNDVSLEVQRGKTLGLVGETGAGKTTIAKSILRILPDPPAKIDSGEIYVDGEDVLKMSEHQMLEIRGNKIAMIFQDPMTALNPVMSVGEQISESVLIHRNCTQEEARERAMEMLEMVGITPERYVEFPYQFSGGMKQRVVIAMALACDPELLLADEPTTALDVTIQAQVLEMINDLKEKFNMAMILITHDLGVVAETCDDVAVVYAGQIVEYGDKRSVYKSTSHPYTMGLFNSIPRLDDEGEKIHLKPIPGMPLDPTIVPDGCSFCDRCAYASEACRTTKVPLYRVGENHYCRCLRFSGGATDVQND